MTPATSLRATDVVRGRDEPLAVLREAVGRAKRGIGAAVFIEGDGGIGKTRLIEEIAREAGASGIETHVGRAEELERARPFGAVAHALRGLGRDVRDLLWGTADESTTGSAPSVSDARVVELLLDVIEERAIRRPVLICVEDLHWADPATLLFIRATVRRLEGLPLAIVGTYRPFEGSSALSQLIDRGVAEGHRLIQLGPLTDDDVELLVRDAVDRDPGPLLLREVARGSGSPFFVLELLAALHDEGAIVQRDGLAELDRAVLPPTLRLTILRRLASLPHQTLDTLRLASVVGSGFAVDDVALLDGHPTLDLFAVLDPAIRAGFITERDDRLGFRHDLVHAAIYEDMSAPLRKTLHRKLAEAMAVAGRPVTTVATHMSLGADPGDLQAASWLMQACVALGGKAHGVGVEFGRSAIELAPPNASILDDFIALHHVVALTVTGYATEAEALSRELLSRVHGAPSVARARHALAYALNDLGRLEEAVAERELIQADHRLPEELKCHYDAELAQMLFNAGHLDRAVAVAEEALEASSRCKSASGFSVAHMTLSFVATARGRVRDAIQHGMDSSKASDEVWTSNLGLPVGRIASGLALMEGDDGDRSLEELRIGLQRAIESGVANDVLFMRAMSLVHLVRGDWDDAIAEAAASLERWDETYVGRMVAFGVPALIHLERGDFDAARTVLGAGDISLSAPGDLIGADLFLWAKARWLEAQGDGAAALDALTLVWSATENMRYLFGSWRAIWPDLARLAVSGGRQSLADEVAAAADEGARLAGGIASVDAAALRINGHVQRDPDALAGASDLYETTPRPMERAMAADDAGLALMEHGQTQRATAFLTRAFDLYDALGATGQTDRINAHLRSLGVRHGRRGARKRPSSGWDALTPTELRVVALVGVGLTNSRIGERLFISPRTVQTHMRSVFDKLGVVSRAEVVAEVVRRGI